MRVMAAVGLIFDMRRRDRDSTLSLLWSFINGAILEEFGITLFRLSFRDRSSQCSLAVINMTNRA